MFGGTPSNLALSCMNGSTVEVVAGINLPMLIKLASVRDEESLERGGVARPGGGPQIHQHRVARPDREMSPMDPDDDCPPAPMPEGARIRELPIINRRGLHARASAKFVQTVEHFDSDVTVTRCGETVGGRSIMGLLTLGRRAGHHHHGDGQGPGRRDICLTAIGDLLANRFGEDE